MLRNRIRDYEWDKKENEIADKLIKKGEAFLKKIQDDKHKIFENPLEL